MTPNPRKSWICGFLFLSFALLSLSALAGQDGEDVVIGKYRILHSQVLDEDRMLLVHLPRGYEEDKIRYPVLFHLYGDNITDYFAPAMIACDKLGQTGECPPIILVGVANTNRYRDNLPFNADGSVGGADAFIRFFEEDLIPFIDRNYRTHPFRIVAGPQAGAIFALYALLRDPSVFDMAIITNPFLGDERIARRLYGFAEDAFSKNPSLDTFLYMASEDTEPEPARNFFKEFEALATSRGTADFDLASEIDKGSGFFITPVPVLEALRRFFPDFRLPEDFEAAGVEDVKNYYGGLSERYGIPLAPPELMLTFTGDDLQQRGLVKEAMELYGFQLELYPYSLNAYWRLGEAHRIQGRYEEALENYRKLLSIRATDMDLPIRRVQSVERYMKESAVFLIERETERAGIEAGLDLYRKLKSDPQNTRTFEEGDINALGYRLLNRNQVGDAIQIFAINVALYPRSANVHDSLGEAHARAGDIDKAIRSYQKSLELDPANENAQEMLERLKKKKERLTKYLVDKLIN